MNNIDQLRQLMTLDANINTTGIEERFEQIAKMLFESFAIQKGEKKYLFKEIEFYFYNKNHRDIITYPRSSKPLCWYNNRFGGIDLNFESNIECRESKKYNLDDNAYFGGILIRQLVCVNEVGNVKVLCGPLKCAELFKHNDTTSSFNEPHLVKYDNGIVGYIRRPRINILQPKQMVKDKVNSILNNYHVYPEKEKLCDNFTTFKGKLYRYIRCDKLRHDEDTNMVFISPWLKDKIEGHSDFYRHLKDLLNEIGIESKELKSTNDYWARDYMPIQLDENEFLKYYYCPDYLINKDDIDSITDVSKVISGMGLNCRSTNLIIDGGNMVPCGPYIVMTDKVFSENRKKKDDADFKALLESELGHPVIIIPWTPHEDDVYGHSDGFIKWCGDNRILMGNHGDCYPEEAASIRRILESYGFEVTEMRFNGKVDKPCYDLNWAYINFLQVGKNIIMPKFNIEEDSIAQQYIQEAFQDCNIRQIEMAEIAREGGALHCISWNVYLPK
ncbi:MAG: agmatine deiminase family protein [Bacteroidaceae bacterium]|nr:agmatine deiminase family protein [Bacteroidaceae bacterium]